MEDTDIYTLFGNLLDNAIESSSRNPDSESRFIRLELLTRGEMLYVNEENDCTVLPAFTEGFPETTKEDRRMHGFGVRSMEYIVKQYDGEILFEPEEKCSGWRS